MVIGEWQETIGVEPSLAATKEYANRTEGSLGEWADGLAQGENSIPRTL